VRANFLETAFLLARHDKKGHLIAPAARPSGSCLPGSGFWPTDNCPIVGNTEVIAIRILGLLPACSSLGHNRPSHGPATRGRSRWILV
jgi:hypothetical protein